MRRDGPASSPLRLEGEYTRRLKTLMPFRVGSVLLFSSVYDYFVLEADGRLNDLLGAAYSRRNYGYIPELDHAGELSVARETFAARDHDLVICMPGPRNGDSVALAESVKESSPDTPVVALVHDLPERHAAQLSGPASPFDRVFVWLGDGETLLGIIQLAEDSRNAAHDMEKLGLQDLLLVEGDAFFYSRYLHRGMEVIREQMGRILQRERSMALRRLKARLRPKVLMACSAEEAEELLQTHGDHLLGLITSLGFPRGGSNDPTAGRDLIARTRELNPSIPVLIQSGRPEAAELARELDAGFISKRSTTLMRDLAGQLRARFGFGSFTFTDAEGRELRSAESLQAVILAAGKLPSAVVARALRSGNLSRWLRVHTEPGLAARLERTVEEAGEASDDELRDAAHSEMVEWRRESHRGVVTPYSRSFYSDYSRFSRIGSGSAGGKGRGLAFIDRVLANNLDPDRWRRVSVTIPRTLVLTTEVFDEFIRRNDLLDYALSGKMDMQVIGRFLRADLPPTMLGDLRDFLGEVRTPLAVRSSSLLEDALYEPFAGVYSTKMLPNDDPGFDTRFKHLDNAIKLVFASTFLRDARAYIEATSHRVEEEKMAVLIQEVVGRRHGSLFYPHFAGVGRSYNFYPVGSAGPEDGVVNVAVGLGKTIVDGGVSLRFTPRYPRVLPQLGTVQDALDNTQREFWAVGLKGSSYGPPEQEDQFMVTAELDRAEEDGTLTNLASTYDSYNDRLRDGIQTPGARVVTFAHILKARVFPLADITQTLLEMGQEAMGCPVEIEFAVVLGEDRPLPAEFSLLQIRPMVAQRGAAKIDLDEMDTADALVRSGSVLGNGIREDIFDIVYTRPEAFDAADTPKMAAEVERLNGLLAAESRPYLLAGFGRWGSSDHWLGVPVRWGQISGVGAIVEATRQGMNVDASQGSHFFQNMTSLGVPYFTVSHTASDAGVDWQWLDAQPAVGETDHLRHVRLDEPLTVAVDGRSGTGAVLKPDTERRRA